MDKQLLTITTAEHLVRLNMVVYATYFTTEEYCTMSESERRIVVEMFLMLQKLISPIEGPRMAPKSDKSPEKLVKNLLNEIGDVMEKPNL